MSGLVSGNVLSPTTHIANLLQTLINQKPHRKWGSVAFGRMFRVSLFDDTFLCNRLVECFAKSGDLNNARKVFERVPQKNVYSWNAIISAFCKHGNMDEAHKLFVAMPERNVVSWNTLIGGFVLSGYEERGLSFYKQMNKEGFRSSHFTLATVLSAAGKLGDLEMGRQCHSQLVRVGYDLNLYVENALVCMYAKCGCLGDASQVFDGMATPNEVSCTALMSGLALTHHVDEAFQMFGKMQKNGVRIDAVALSSILGICTRNAKKHDKKYVYDEALELAFDIDQKPTVSPDTCDNSGESLGRQLHCMAVKSGYDLDLLVANCLVDMYAKLGSMDEAESVFKTMLEHNTVSWNIMIAGHGQSGQAEKAMELMCLMQETGFQPDEVTYGSLLGAFVKSNNLDTARMIFDQMANPSLTSWNTIVAGYCQQANDKEALTLFRQMQFSGIRPDRTTIAVILSSCAGLGLLHFGRQVHAASIKAILHLDVFVGSGLVDMYSKCKQINQAKLVFVKMTERDVVGWNSMICGLSLHALHGEAYMVFMQMLEDGTHPTQFSYASVLSSCARLSSLAQGKQVHSRIIKDGFDNDIFVGSSLIDMYAKSGSIEDAYGCFLIMPERNIVSWNEMISGFAQSGHGNEAIKLFEQMLKSDEKPDSITFVSVLSACSHCGMVEEAIQYLHSMEEDYGLVPLADHYACVIDSLGRAGRLKEAEELIEKTEYKSDPVILGVLLGACRVHGNISIGKRVAEQLFEIEPHNPSSFVLLANIYSGLGMYDEASNVRKLMNEQRLIKDHAYSWIEGKGRIHAFMVSDDMAGLVIRN
uniref:Pentacotripeptide-repeat region of PRORP domain-containing protein n=2 Tax=Nymphaea colorata TaxID=210225 RepID=A0A5K1AI81_9MAGN